MKRKILVILLCGVMVLGTTGCNTSQTNGKEKNNYDNVTKKVNYSLDEISFSNEIQNVIQILEGGIFLTIYTNDGLYRYSEKKYSNDTYWKKYDFEVNKYRLVGIFNHEIEFIDRSNKRAVIRPMITDKFEPTFYDSDASYGTYNNFNEYLFYNDTTRYEVSNEYIRVNNDNIAIPQNVKIIKHYYVDNLSKKSVFYTDNLFLSDSGDYYYIGVNSNDKCHEYADIKCQSILIKIDFFDDVLNDFKNNISFFNGKYLITKDNKMYIVSYR